LSLVTSLLKVVNTLALEIAAGNPCQPSLSAPSLTDCNLSGLRVLHDNTRRTCAERSRNKQNEQRFHSAPPEKPQEWSSDFACFMYGT
jgi:hypothetical protein